MDSLKECDRKRARPLAQHLQHTEHEGDHECVHHFTPGGVERVHAEERGEGGGACDMGEGVRERAPLLHVAEERDSFLHAQVIVDDGGERGVDLDDANGAELASSVVVDDDLASGVAVFAQDAGELSWLAVDGDLDVKVVRCFEQLFLEQVQGRAVHDERPDHGDEEVLAFSFSWWRGQLHENREMMV